MRPPSNECAPPFYLWHRYGNDSEPQSLPRKTAEYAKKIVARLGCRNRTKEFVIELPFFAYFAALLRELCV
jgi:hypothetical protein